jgi:RNA polymerase sigma-70 factor, ECF subfamily
MRFRDPDVSDLVHRLKGGDRDALATLYTRFRGTVYGYLRGVVRDEHEAEDLTQHVFAKLPTAVRRYEPRESPFAAWLMRVARNAAIDAERRKRLVLVGDAPAGLVASDDTELRRSLRDALDSVPVEQRKVLVMRHVVGLSPGEIADRLDRSEASVHGLHHRGRRVLRKRLEELGSAPRLAA